MYAKVRSTAGFLNTELSHLVGSQHFKRALALIGGVNRVRHYAKHSVDICEAIMTYGYTHKHVRLGQA